jgi:cytochrome c-type biogenesis protein CcmH
LEVAWKYIASMLLWIIFSGLTAVLLAFILRPLAQGATSASADDAAFDMAVYRDQLAELERETEEGLIPPREAETARTEIARRLLKADDKAHERASSRASLRSLALVASIIAVPLFTLSFYLLRGSPQLPGVPLAERLANAESNRDLEALVAKVEAHLAQNPSDAQGWRALAPAYRALGRYEDSARAYAEALRMGKSDASLYADMGEVLAMGSQGLVTKAASDAFDEALKLDAKHPKAHYYRGLARLQEGKPQEALNIWRAMLEDAPEGAPWRALVEKEIARSGGTEQSRMIASMVDGLAQRLARDGSDLDGWLKLARARLVLGEPDKAQDALDRASALFAGNAQALARIEELRQEIGKAVP